MTIAIRNIPPGSPPAFILHCGWAKWSGDKDHATAVHGMAAGAYPFLRKVPPTTIPKALAAIEIAIGGSLFLPFVPGRRCLPHRPPRWPPDHVPAHPGLAQARQRLAHSGGHRDQQGCLDARHRRRTAR
jgi:hypothetical protein